MLRDSWDWVDQLNYRSQYNNNDKHDNGAYNVGEANYDVEYRPARTDDELYVGRPHR
jgi:hypothetical protein